MRVGHQKGHQKAKTVGQITVQYKAKGSKTGLLIEFVHCKKIY
jgi:hypothetical protein